MPRSTSSSEILEENIVSSTRTSKLKSKQTISVAGQSGKLMRLQKASDIVTVNKKILKVSSEDKQTIETLDYLDLNFHP